MIEDLGAQARALLDAAREGMTPDAAAVRRVRAKLAVATGGAAAGAAIGTKLAIVAVVAAVVAGAGLYATRNRATAVAPNIELASPAELPLRAAVREPAAPAIPAISDDDLITIETSPRAAPRPVSRTTAPAATPPSAPATIGLAREVELVDLAMAALRRGDADGALSAVRRHAAETAGRGQLAEDAAAIEIEALCRLHDPTTNAKLEAFDARFPRSAQRSRLSNRCP